MDSTNELAAWDAASGPPVETAFHAPSSLVGSAGSTACMRSRVRARNSSGAESQAAPGSMRDRHQQ